MTVNIPQKQLQGPTGDPTEEIQQFSIDPFSYLDNCVQKYGDIFRLPYCVEGNFIPTVVISNPEAVQIFGSPATLKYLENQQAPVLDYQLGGNQHLTSLDKAGHQQMKKLMMPYFHGSAIQAQAQRIWTIAQRLSDVWANGEPFWVLQTMGDLTLEVIVQIVCGITEGPRYEALKHGINAWLTWGSSPEVAQALYVEEMRQDQSPDSVWGKHLNHLKQIDEILYGEIQARQAEPETQRQDILSMLLAAQDEDGNSLSDVQIRDSLLLNLFAGKDAAAAAMAWAFYALGNHPAVLTQLRQELDAAGANGANPDFLAIYRLPYLGAVCKEILRLYAGSVLSVSRLLNDSIEFMGYRLEPGTALSTSYYLLHKRPDLYPEPEKFRPERFLEREYGSHELAPFGIGHRRCLGYALAEMEIKLSLAVFMSRYQLRRMENEPIKLVRRNLLLYPERDFQVQAVV
jgi:unspecific monooxygenase